MSAQPRPWCSVHVYCHTGLDVVLREAVLPLVEDVHGRGLVDQSFFLRYWEGGTHLRLRLLLGSDEARPSVENKILR